MPTRQLSIQSPDRAHSEASIFRAQANELLDKAARLEITALEGWAKAEYDAPYTFTAVYRTGNHTHCEDCHESIVSFLKRVKAKHPDVAEISLSIIL
jgi:hypothetical protein